MMYWIAAGNARASKGGQSPKLRPSKVAGGI